MTLANPAAATMPYPSPSRAWYIVAVLLVLYWLSMVDRLVMSLLVAPIRQDLGISDFELSLLQGFAFGIFYATCGLPLGWMVDRYSRRWIIFGGVTLWTLSTVGCGLARNYWHLFTARVGIGAGEASLSPAAYSILADNFPPQKLTFALMVFGLGSLLGTSAAYLCGGLVVDWVGQRPTLQVPLLGELRSWQAVFIAVGLPGIPFALLVFTFPEPVRRGLLGLRGGDAAAGFGAMFRFMAERKRFFLTHHAGFTLAIAAVTGWALWAPAHMSRQFGWSPTEIGAALGLTLLVSGIGGSLVVGRLLDRWFASGRRDAQMRWMAGCALLAAPLAVFTGLSDSPWVFIAGIGVLQILMGPVMPIASSALQLVTPAEFRGRVSSLYLFINILLGIGLGPSLVAACTDFVFRDDARLGASLALVAGIAYPLAALVLAAGCKSMREALEPASQDPPPR